MRHRTIMLAAVCAACVAALAAPTTQKLADKLVFKKAGFSIAPLDEPRKSGGQILLMYLPQSETLGANVNVLTQQYSGTLEEYDTLSKKQFEDGKLSILSEQKVNGAVTWEYSGEMKGLALHFYAKAVLKSGTVYLATGTATESKWKDVGRTLKACVDRLETMPN